MTDVQSLVEAINTHNLVVDFGKHKGEAWTRLPLSYLKWLANECDGERKKIAEVELDRRGAIMPTVLELSGHAIDRASQITNVWKKQGVYSWLMEMGNGALYEALGAEEVEYEGYKFAFAYGDYYPRLKTIIKLK